MLLARPAGALASPINIPYGQSWPLSVVVDSARGLLYVDALSGLYPPIGFSLGIISTTSHQVVKVLPLNDTPGPMVVDTTTGEVYVAGSHSIEVFYGENRSQVEEISVGNPILDMAFDPRVSHNLFFTSGNGVFALDPKTGVVVSHTTVAGEAGGVVIDPTSDRILVGDYVSPEIAIFQASTLASAGVINLPSCCAARLALDSNRHTIYATTGSNYIDVIDATAGTFLKTVTVAPSSGNSTNVLAVDNYTGRVFVSSSPGGSIIELSGQGGKILRSFAASYEVAGLAYDSRTGALYATNYHQVTVFDVGRERPPILLILTVGSLAVVLVASIFVFFWRRRGGKQRVQPGRGTY